MAATAPRIAPTVASFCSRSEVHKEFEECSIPGIPPRQMEAMVPCRWGLCICRGFCAASSSPPLRPVYSVGSSTVTVARKPFRHWRLRANVRGFFEEAGKQLGITQMSDWYSVPRKKVAMLGCGGLFKKPISTLEGALRLAYPEYPWESSRFDSHRAPDGYWHDVQHQKDALARIGKELEVNELDDWYRIRKMQVKRVGGAGLFHAECITMEQLLKRVYPDFPWDPSRFVAVNNTPRGYWMKESNLLRALELAEQKMGIKSPEDWYSVALTDLREIGFPAHCSKMRLVDLLREKYPNHVWDVISLMRGRHAKQKRLERVIAAMFPNEEIKLNVRKEAQLINPQTGYYLELDVYIPNLRLAFECNELHHYGDSSYAQIPLSVISTRDRAKQELARQNGVTLITVPPWWDGTEDSLRATIRALRPDVVPQAMSEAKPIPVAMPEDFKRKELVHIEDIGSPITACFFTKTDVNPSGWWVFEKYDGVRGFWNPHKRAFYSRLGNQLELPQEITDAMPTNLFLDGELWFGRENFQESMKIPSKVMAKDIDWTKFKYMVFDVPNHGGTYAERYTFLVSPYVECKDMGHLEGTLQDILDKGGEGIILRNPQSPYLAGRSSGFLKHKRFRDAEARIVEKVGHIWKCELPNGMTFSAPPGTSEFVKRNPSPGDIVTFRHRGFLLRTNIPKLPELYRLRTDLTWEAVVQNWKEKKSTAMAPPLGNIPQRAIQKPKGYWRDIEHRREVFLQFAADAGFDPFVPKNWNNVSMSQFIAKKGKAVFQRCTLRQALKRAFPELDFQFEKYHAAKTG